MKLKNIFKRKNKYDNISYEQLEKKYKILEIKCKKYKELSETARVLGSEAYRNADKENVKKYIKIYNETKYKEEMTSDASSKIYIEMLEREFENEINFLETARKYFKNPKPFTNYFNKKLEIKNTLKDDIIQPEIMLRGVMKQ